MPARRWTHVRPAMVRRRRRGRATRETGAEELLIAEGSDWFWWYGDDHSSDHDRGVRRAVPPAPAQRLRRARPAGPGRPVQQQHHDRTGHRAGDGCQSLDSPMIDGRVTHYGEWADAVDVRSRDAAGAMHQVANDLVRSLHLAADRMTVYLRLDGAELVRRLKAGAHSAGLMVELPGPPRRLELTPPITWAVQDIVEIAVPIAVLGGQAGDRVRLSVPGRGLGRPDARTAPVAPARGPRSANSSFEHRQLGRLARATGRVSHPQTFHRPVYLGFCRGSDNTYYVN